ncbi:unnamed protein product, partial [Mesorhabditis belari]|uniref:WD repeat-containing protein 19 n=1 Tax=Mesorhabditis belari TaxID=2138241 RepID=A0AAF3E863_9BILA
MQNVNVDLAVRIFRHIGEVSMVWALDEVNDMEEKTLVAGHLALLIEDFDAAEKNFLNSSQPLEALDMRRDLLHWPKALQLAQKFAKDQIPFISKEYAQQLEFMGDYSTAMQHYTDGILDEEETEEILEHNDVCRSGVARMAIRIGDIRRGIQLASKIEGRAVKKECAMILEQLKQFNDAVQVYEIGQFYDRAAAAALKAKNWSKVNELLPKVRSPKIHAQYGRVMEGEKKYKEAAMAYKNAKDYDNLVRVLLDHLNLADEAVRVVRESRSVEGAKHVAKFFTKLGDHTSAIQFLVLSQCQQEAYQLAEQTGKMEDYAEALGDTATIEQYAQVAEHFATQGSTLLAGIYHFKAGHYSVSMDYLLSLGENHEALRTAIECVAEAGDQGLVHRLTQFLLGETDQIPKDAKYLFRMYVALNMTREAARTAVVIARDEQSRGNYKVARDLLYAMYQDLQEKNIAVPLEMQQSLMLIHSYLIVKNLIRRDETLKAARMLIRVAQNISRFSTHSVSILTSAVVICTKAGLKGAAHRYAVQLMQPENRNRIDAKYRKKIEQLVRKADKPSDGEEPKASCPYCKHPVIETELMCAMCKNTIPYCVITGRHVVAEDFAVCDGCKFPGYFTEFKRLAAIGETCPMCGGNCGQVMPSDWETFIASTRTKKDEL